MGFDEYRTIFGPWVPGSLLFRRDVHSLVFVNYLALAAVVTSPLLGWAFEESWLRRPNAWALTLLFLLASLASLGETLLAVGLKMETAAKVRPRLGEGWKGRGWEREAGNMKYE